MARTRRLVVLGGSGASTPELADAVAAWPGGQDRRPPLELVLAGRSRDKLALVARAFRARLGSGGPPVAVREATDLAAAVDGADVILNQVRIGGLAARTFDESFPRAFGIPGEETMGPGGFANAVRTLPALRETWTAVAERAPDALVVNLTNPAGIVVQAAIREFGVRAIAVCDSPVVLADAVAARLGRPVAEVRCRYAGMNHLGWWVAEQPATLDLVADLATGLSAEEVRTIGALPAPYGRYYHVPGRLLAAQGSGPTRAEALLRLERELLAAYGKGWPAAPRRGAAWYPKAVVPFLDAWWNGSEVPVLLGLPNAGRVSGPGDEAIVEHAVAVPTPGRLEPIVPPPLPALPAGLLAAHAAYEALTVDALLAGGDRRSLTRALAANPLVGDLDRAAALVDAILAASAATSGVPMNARPRREGAARTGRDAPEPVLVGAVDVGATKTLVTVRTLPVATWELGRALRLQTAHDPEAALDAIAAALVRLSGGRPLGAVGVGVPGPLDPASGVIAHSPNLAWREIPFGPALTTRLGVPVILDDDARSGALGEAVLGAGSGADPVAYLTLSTGIGSGIVVAGELVRGAHGFAGEVGHLVIDPAGPPCACGRRGCVESFAGGASLARRARLTWPDGRLADGRPSPLDAPGVLRLARTGDVAALALANDAARALARALAALAAIIDPERIVIGGSLGLGQRALVRRATVLSRRLAIPEAGRTLAVVPASLRGESVLAGAAILAARVAQAAGTSGRVDLAGGARGRA